MVGSINLDSHDTQDSIQSCSNSALSTIALDIHRDTAGAGPPFNSGQDNVMDSSNNDDIESDRPSSVYSRSDSRSASGSGLAAKDYSQSYSSSYSQSHSHSGSHSQSPGLSKDGDAYALERCKLMSEDELYQLISDQADLDENGGHTEM